MESSFQEAMTAFLQQFTGQRRLLRTKIDLPGVNFRSADFLKQVDTTCPSGIGRKTFEVLKNVTERDVFCEGDMLKTLRIFIKIRLGWL